MNLGLESKTAIVTGSGSGIGKAIALTLAEEGANVVVVDIDAEKGRSTADQIRALGRQSAAVQTDVTKPQEVDHMAAQVLKEFKTLDILVNNAGWAFDAAHFAESNLKENWKPTIDLCLIGTLNCCKAVIEPMISQKKGKIVNIISDAGRVGEPMLSSYSAAKGGIVAFSKALAKDVGKHAVNVNCVSPGATSTEGMKARWEEVKKEIGEEAFEQRQRKMRSVYPIARGLERIAKPEDIADMVVFFCSERSDFITGQIVSVSGGYCMI